MNRLTIRQACEQLRCSRWTLDRLFRAGKLTKITDGRNVYVDATELARYIERTFPARPSSVPTPAYSPEQIAALIQSVDQLKEQLVDATRQRVA